MKPVPQTIPMIPSFVPFCGSCNDSVALFLTRAHMQQTDSNHAQCKLVKLSWVSQVKTKTPPHSCKCIKFEIQKGLIVLCQNKHRTSIVWTKLMIWQIVNCLMTFCQGKWRMLSSLIWSYRALQWDLFTHVCDWKYCVTVKNIFRRTGASDLFGVE